jgi:hypothetical protein
LSPDAAIYVAFRKRMAELGYREDIKNDELTPGRLRSGFN